MTKAELKTILEGYTQQGNCFTIKVRDILTKYKEAGGQQNSAITALNEIKNENLNNETVQDGADDILDIVTGWCCEEMRIWDEYK